jgi:hypothetical protein
MLNAAPNETETPHQRKIRLQNEQRQRQSEQQQQEREQQRLEQQEHAVIMQMPITLTKVHKWVLRSRDLNQTNKRGDQKPTQWHFISIGLWEEKKKH